MYDMPPHCFGLTGDTSVESMDLDKWLQDRQVFSALIKQHLHHATLRMKQQADKGLS
jgi:hypothetical protein